MLLLASNRYFQFHSCEFLRHELQKHQQKLLKLTSLTEPELLELKNLITQNITFINEEFIPVAEIQAAELLVSDIDQDDPLFVALTNDLKAKLWTGDKELIKGLRAKGYTEIITTGDIYELFEKLERG